LKTFGLPVSEAEKPWLEVAKNYAHLPIAIINRTKRHRNDLFPWEKVLNKYVFEDVFVGTQEEFNDFSLSTEMPVEYTPTETLLDLAQIIDGCALFIGNQSAAYAIAEGLKKPVIQEVYLPTPNCIFRRPNAQFVTGSEIELPELSELR
jgi:ADP-heptose:LPS heptosyltransferase